MTEQYLGPVISGVETNSDLRLRKSKDIYQTVSASKKKLIADKVKLEAADGWRPVRKNAKSTLMAKPKPLDEQLEDEVWCFLAGMGFKELSLGRRFTIVEKSGLPPRQIDVFAKDDETALVVECTRRDTPGKKRMDNLIEKIKSFREPIRQSIVTHYGGKPGLKVRYVIATRNIEWSDADHQKCREAEIAVISDSEIDYYTKLVGLMRRAARYQLLAHMFEGKVAGLARKVVATQGKMGNAHFYTFLISPDDLLKIAYVGHRGSRDIEDIDTYQRMLVPSRLKKIAKFINDGGKFPTNIVVNLKTKRPPKFDIIEKVGNLTVGKLHLPAQYGAAWIIDGQHRLYGYAYAREAGGFNADKTTVPALAYLNLPAEDEMNLFVDINSKQVKVSSGLLSEIYADLHWGSRQPEQAFQALLSRISGLMNSQKLSPLLERMVVSGKGKTSYRCLTLTSIRDGLKASKLVGSMSKGVILPGPFSTPNAIDYDANLKKSLALLSHALRMFSDAMPDHWNLGDALGGYLCTNIGLRAIFLVLKDVSDHVQLTTGADIRVMTANDAFDALRPFLKELVEYFVSANSQEIFAFRKIGSSLAAVRRQAYEMEDQIQMSLPDFRPLGLQEYRDSRDVAGTEDAQCLIQVLKIQKRLFDYVVGTLKKHYGTNQKMWWVKGIPSEIRQECSSRWEEKDRQGDEESELYLIDYIAICITNWDLVKDVISLDAKDKEAKKVNTIWIRKLNGIRNKVAHPEQGDLTTDQVASVNEIFEKVDKIIPEYV